MLAMFAALLLSASYAAPLLWVPGVEGWGAREAAPEPGTQVLALCGDRLEETTVRADGERIDVGCDATFVVSGVPGLEAHKVTRARTRSRRWLRSSPSGPGSVVLRLGKKAWRIDRIRVSSTGYRLQLRALGDGRSAMTLYEAQSTDAARWQVLWAGDLDGDHQLDLLLEASDASDLRELHLYLSRDAEELVEESAWARVRVR